MEIATEASIIIPVSTDLKNVLKQIKHNNDSKNKYVILKL